MSATVTLTVTVKASLKSVSAKMANVNRILQKNMNVMSQQTAAGSESAWTIHAPAPETFASLNAMLTQTATLMALGAVPALPVTVANAGKTFAVMKGYLTSVIQSKIVLVLGSVRKTSPVPAMASALSLGIQCQHGIANSQTNLVKPQMTVTTPLPGAKTTSVHVKT